VTGVIFFRELPFSLHDCLSLNGNYSAFHQYSVAVQVAADLFENKENTRSVLLHSSMFDAVIGRISGELNSYIEID